METRLYGLVALNTTMENLSRYFSSTANEAVAQLMEEFENYTCFNPEQLAAFSTLTEEQQKVIHAAVRMYIMKAAHRTANSLLKMVARFAMN